MHRTRDATDGSARKAGIPTDAVVLLPTCLLLLLITVGAPAPLLVLEKVTADLAVVLAHLQYLHQHGKQT